MNADWIAAAYRWIEYAAFGRALERCRTCHLHDASTAARVLIIGEGDGRFLASLLASNSLACVDVVESSRSMIGLAERRLSPRDRPRVRFFCKDIVGDAFPGSGHDLVVTNFVLDCFQAEDAKVVVGKLSDALLPGGCWIVGEFQLPAKGWRRWHAAVWVRAMYLFFRLTTGLRARQIPDCDGMIRERGLVLRRERTQRFDLIVSQLWEKPI